MRFNQKRKLKFRQITSTPEKVDPVQLMKILDNRRVRVEDYFYQDKAEKLFLESNFLMIPTNDFKFSKL